MFFVVFLYHLTNNTYLCNMEKTIGYDAKRIVRNASGLGNYGRTLINDLSKLDVDTRLLLYAPDEGRKELREQIVRRNNVAFRYAPCRTRLGKDLWRRRGIVKDLVNDGVRLFHGLSGELPTGLCKAGIRSVVTIHDLIFLRHPEYYHPLDVWLYRRKFHATLKEADRVIAISECTKRDILYYSHFPEDRIDVIYQSCSARFAQPLDDADRRKREVWSRYALPEHFVLNVGTIEPRKNVLLAVKSMSQWPESLHLVIVGRTTPYAREVMNTARQMGVAQRVHVLTDVPNDDLMVIYKLADCFVYPSRYEGFGIPIIEAIQSGLPVVAATQSCLEEAGGPDSLYVDPDDADGLARAIATAIQERDGRVEASRKYVKRFENTNVAQQVAEVYNRLL